MARYKIAIRLVETYENQVVVEAADLDEAIRKVEEEWRSDTHLYEDTTDIIKDQDVQFFKCGMADEEDIRNLINIC